MNNGKNTKCLSFLFSERDPRRPGPQMKLPQVGPVDELCVGRVQRPLPMICPGDVYQEPDARPSILVPLLFHSPYMCRYSSVQLEFSPGGSVLWEVFSARLLSLGASSE